MSDRFLSVQRYQVLVNGSPSYQETVATVSPTSARNATAFPAGAAVMLQADGAFYFTTGGSTSVAAAASGVKVAQDEKVIITLAPDQTHIAVLAVAGTVNVKYFRLK